MERILEYLQKNIREDKLLDIEKTEFLSKFLRGAICYNDFVEIRDNFPEYLEDLSFKEEWIDSNKTRRYIDGNEVCLTKNDTVLCDVCFRDDKVRFARFSLNGLFSIMDNFICHNGKVYKGSIPKSEIKSYMVEEIDNFYLQSTRNQPKFYFEIRLKVLAKRDIRIHYQTPNVNLQMAITLKNKTCNEDNFDIFVNEGMDIEEIYKANEKLFKNLYKKCYTLRESDYKKDCLDGFLYIFDTIEEIVKSVT